MPAHYAHTSFGRKVFDTLPPEIKEQLNPNKELFLIGLQGPDILFYYKPFAKTTIPKMGHTIHLETGNQVIERFFQLSGSDGDQAKKTYMAGFLCHYMLDSACHPLVDSSVITEDIDHCEIEAEFDKYLMTKKGLNPFHHDPLSHLLNDQTTCETIATFYPGTNDSIISDSIAAMRKITKLNSGLLTDIRPLTMFALRAAGKYDSFQGLILKKETNEDCKHISASLEKILENQIVPTGLLIQEFMAIDQADSFLPKDRFKSDFSGN